jgi:hypothetical protein
MEHVWSPADATVANGRKDALSTRMAGDRVPRDPVASAADIDVVTFGRGHSVLFIERVTPQRAVGDQGCTHEP